MRRLLVVLMLAGCHARASTEHASQDRTPPYAPLFYKGRSWSLPVRGGAPVTCTVRDFKLVANANVSRLDCGALLVSGTWVATAAGLYHPYVPVDEPDELTLLGEDDLLLRSIPSERDHEHVLVGGARSSTESFRFGASWCVRETTTSGADLRSYTLCFDGTNITGGGEDTSEPAHVYFGVAPPSDSDDS